MKWHAWSKWPLLGVTATAVVLAAPPDAASTDTAPSYNGRKEVNAAAPSDPQQSAPAQPQQLAPTLPQAVTHDTPRTGQQMGRIELERLTRARPEAAAEKTEVANAFNSVSWYEPPPPPPLPSPEPEPSPVAPPLPFTYFGLYEDPPTRIVMLTRNEMMYTVSEGDVIDEIYRIERIADGSVAIVYLPLGTVQSINTGQSISMRAQ